GIAAAIARHRSDGFRKNGHGNIDDRRQRLDIIGLPDRTCRLGMAIILEIAAQRVDAFVIDAPSDAARLRQYRDRLLGVAEMFVGKARARGVDLESALHHQRPGDKNVMRRRNRAVTLIGAHIERDATQRLTPPHRISLVADMSEIERLGHLGNMTPQHLDVAAIAVAREYQGIAADFLARAIGTEARKSTHAAVGIRIEIDYMRFGDDVYARPI